MTYVELIVVLSIFSVMSSIILFNYSSFQAKVDIKNLASDIALKIVQAQKEALSGKLQPLISTGWNPSYGVYFDIDPSTGGDNKNFIYFADSINPGIYDGFFSCTTTTDDVCLDKINIAKNDYISNLDVFYQGATTSVPLSDLTVTFSRPSSSAIIVSSQIDPLLVSSIDHVQITIESPNGSKALIKVYSSGRIQVD